MGFVHLCNNKNWQNTQVFIWTGSTIQIDGLNQDVYFWGAKENNSVIRAGWLKTLLA